MAAAISRIAHKVNFGERRGGPVGWYFCLAVALGISLYSWLPLLHANWSIVDDHEVMAAIGMRERLPVGEIYTQLRQTEVADASKTMRFRPSYYLIRFTEAAAWGKNVTAWYAARIVIACLFAGVVAHFAVRAAGATIGFGFLIFALSKSYWSDIFARLGPAETYAVFGIALVYVGAYRIIKQRGGDASSWLVALGACIAAGSKENFLLLAPVLIWLLFQYQHRLSVPSRVPLYVGLLYMTWITYSEGMALLESGHDVYRQSVLISERTALLPALLQNQDFRLLLAVTAVLSFLAMMFQLFERKANPTKASQATVALLRAALSLSLLLLLFAAQFVFYNGNWPGSQLRYYFPGVFAVDVALLVAIATLVYVLRFYKQRWHAVLPPIASLVMLSFAMPDVQANHAHSKEVAISTTRFVEKLDSAKEYLRANPTAPLILNSHYLGDYEPIVSIGRFMRAAGIKNTIAVRIDRDSPPPFLDDPALAFPEDSHLANALQSPSGLQGWDMVPFARIDVDPTCFSFGFSGPPFSQCKQGTSVWPL